MTFFVTWVIQPAWYPYLSNNFHILNTLTYNFSSTRISKNYKNLISNYSIKHPLNFLLILNRKHFGVPKGILSLPTKHPLKIFSLLNFLFSSSLKSFQTNILLGFNHSKKMTCVPLVDNAHDSITLKWFYTNILSESRAIMNWSLSFQSCLDQTLFYV